MPPRAFRLLRYLRYLWAGPTTLLGVAAATLAFATGGAGASTRGVLEVYGGFATWLLRRVGASAMTLGHVVLARDADAHEWAREHERIHVRQVERWGPLFLPAYALASAMAWARGAHYYFDNRFEVEAYALDGRGRRHA